MRRERTHQITAGTEDQRDSDEPGGDGANVEHDGADNGDREVAGHRDSEGGCRFF